MLAPPPGGSVFQVSPLSPLAAESDSSTRSQIITITPAAHRELVSLRAAEPDADRLGLRLEIISGAGEDFRYDLSFDVVTKAAFTDEVRTHVDTEQADEASQGSGPSSALKVIIPAKDVELLEGAVLDHTDSQGLVIRNPNRPKPPSVEGLVRDDELSAEVEAVVADEVNPALAAHGGFVTFVGHDGEGTVYLTMGGGCHGCSMSRVTMLDGVQTMLVERIAGVERVKDITDHATGENPFYR
jgi:Fe/S biogenesis protein NfuA